MHLKYLHERESQSVVCESSSLPTLFLSLIGSDVITPDPIPPAPTSNERIKPINGKDVANRDQTEQPPDEKEGG